MDQKEMTNNVILEMRRGALVLAALSQLDREQYGYSLLKTLSDRGLGVDQGTLYPLLRRLETQGVLRSAWRVEDAHPRRYYIVSEAGQKILPKLKQEWLDLIKIMDSLLNEKKEK
jgi:PadR family transcriptional regulator, regulatory protein PadR